MIMTDSSQQNTRTMRCVGENIKGNRVTNTAIGGVEIKRGNHPGLTVNPGHGITLPQKITNKRIGVNDSYTSTGRKARGKMTYIKEKAVM